MKLLPRHIVFISLLALSQNCAAQTQDVKFNLVSGTNGISLGKINGMTRDKFGFMWLSDQSNRCIIRYDGNKMIRYQNDPKNSNSLGGAYPECLFADSSGIIWIGFYGMGLDRFDPLLNTFTHYRHKKDDPESLSSDVVSAIIVDHLGNVWVGNDGGLDLLDTKTGKFKHYKYMADDPSSLSSNTVRIIYEDKAGELWIGTGYPWVENSDGGLNRFNRNTGTFTRYQHDPKNQQSLIDNKVRAIFEDSYGDFWIGTRGDGLHTMDRKTGLITRLTNNADKPELLSRPPLKGPTDHITFITEDADKKLWIGTFANGVIRYDHDTKRTTHYTEYSGNTTATKDTSSWQALASPDGLLWMSTQNANFYRIDLHNNIIPHFGNSGLDAVAAFFEESPGTLWFGKVDGLIRKDEASGNMTRFVHEQNHPGSLSNNDVSSIIKDKKGNLWIGTRGGGLNRFDNKTGTFTTYINAGAKGTPQNISVIQQHNDSSFWIGTIGGGLNSFNPTTGKFTQYFRDESDFSNTNINSNLIVAIQEGDSNYLWIGTPETGGIAKRNPQTGKFKVYLSGLSVNCTYKDKDGFIWAGTDGGLFRYDRESDNFFAGTEINDALNIPNAFCIIGDNENNLWIVSTPGMYKLNPKRDHAILYGKDNGIAQGNDFAYASAYKTSDGKLYFGNVNGYYSFYPGKIDIKPVSAQLYFTNFWLNSNEIKPGINSLLKKTILETNEILLEHNQNVFSFGFSVIDFRKGDNRVYYKLENYDNEWRTAGSENKAEYFKVPPGKYVLHIKTSNSGSGEWIEKTMAVIISPPWWNTWWAYCIYGVLFVGLAISIHRYQRARLIKAERERTRAKELEQAKEIEKAYHELRTTQAQLIQSEKMASLGELTAGIAHEIQNPLNFVNNFSEVSRELIDEVKNQKEKLKKEELDELLGDIDANLEKINHHGKRADAIVKGMLQHSRTSTNQKEPADINALADEYLRLSYHGIRAKDNSFNATMKTDFDESIGKINIIPQDIGRVLLNLYNNAFYATNEKLKSRLLSGQKEQYEPVITVSTKKNAGTIEIKVADNGNGIPQKAVDKIFQPFFTTKPTGQGTGLGLSLSYDIVKAHGGEIKVETKEGEFTQFIIQLPVS